GLKTGAAGVPPPSHPGNQKIKKNKEKAQQKKTTTKKKRKKIPTKNKTAPQIYNKPRINKIIKKFGCLTTTKIKKQ
ncbi:hypothetical protein, partial [Salmonella enterica]|uniref:hypothetical protein n=1 Tax=Salmonella enterica TaxID=28901 RepID=UPI001F3D9C2D